jgi:putative ABC transport system permease protein
MRPITRSVLRKLWKMKWRTVAISSVIAVAMAMIVTGWYAAAVLDESTEKFFDDYKMADTFIDLSGDEDAGEIAAVLDASDDVKHYDLRLFRDGVYDPDDREIAAVFIGIEEPADRDVIRFQKREGRYFRSSGEAVAIVGMEDYGVKVGATIPFEVSGNRTELRITGLVSSPEYLFTSAYTDYGLPMAGSLVVVYMPLSDLQDLTGDGVNNVIVILEDGGSGDAVVEDLEPFGTDSVTKKDEHPSVTMMSVGADKMKAMFPLLGAIFMLIGFISIFMTMMRLVQNDSRYIGVLMSLGYSKRDIMRSWVAMGLVICLIGAVIGTVITFVLVEMIVGVGTAMYYRIDLIYPFDPMPFLLGIGFVMIAVLVSVIIPVYLITRASVREALDYKPRTNVHTTRFGSRRMSKVTLMGFRNTTRNPWRMLVTVIVVGMTIGVAGSWLIMVDSAFSYVNDQIDADTWDLSAEFERPMAADGVNASTVNLSGSDVEYVIPYTSLFMTTSSGGRSEGVTVIGCDHLDETRKWEMRDGRTDFRGAVLTNKLADDIDADVGDAITLRMGGNEVMLRITGISYHSFLSNLYTERRNLEAFYDLDNCSGVYIKLADPGSSKAAARDVRAAPSVSSVLIHDDITDTLDSVVDDAKAFLYVFFLMNLLITIVVAGSAVILATMERDVEFATLDTLGIPRRRVAKSIMAEMSLLALMSSAIGIPFAYAFAGMLAFVMAEVIFYFPIMITIGATITTFLIGAAFVMMSSVVPIRYSGKLDTEKTIRERTAG